MNPESAVHIFGLSSRTEVLETLLSNLWKDLRYVACTILRQPGFILMAVPTLALGIGQGLMLTLFGIILGLFASLTLTRLVMSLLFNVTATDPLTFIYVSLFLTLVAVLAHFIPARRATRVDPMAALRHE